AQGMGSLYVGPGASVGKSFFNEALSTSLGCAYNWSQTNGKSASSLLNSNLGVRWNMKFLGTKYGTHSMNGNAGLTNWLKSEGAKRRYEMLASVNYSVRF
ncbi:MAG: hypothetical protein II623_13215, partial [Paludibacteraceae bacterium]|nr:hypothetical protein [Paludibacteraceae bacterium]